MPGTNAWIGEFDPSRREAISRSLSTTSAGAVLLQTSISKVVQLLTNRHLGVQSTIPRRPGTGDGFYSNRRSAAATGGAWVLDTDEPVTAEGTYTQVKFGFKTLLGRITITRRLVTQGKTYGDVMATELVGKTDDLANDLETTSITGDAINGSTKEIDGLLTLIGAVSGQTIANTTAAAGDSLYISKLDKTIQTVRGNADKAMLRIYCNFVGHRLINNALQAQQRFLPSSYEIEGGFTVESYNGIPIVESTGMPDTLKWNGAAPLITDFTTGSTTAIVIVNTEYVFYAELTPLTVMPLAKKSSQYDEMDIFNDLVLVLDNTNGAAILGGLKTTGV